MFFLLSSNSLSLCLLSGLQVIEDDGSDVGENSQQVSSHGAVVDVVQVEEEEQNLVKGQAIQLGLLAVSNTLLQAYSGTIGNVIGVVRCFILPKTQKPLFWKISFIAVQFVITLAMMIFVTKDWAIWQCWIPFTYAVILTCVLDSKSVVVFKIAIAIAQALFFSVSNCSMT